MSDTPGSQWAAGENGYAGYPRGPTLHATDERERGVAASLTDTPARAPTDTGGQLCQAIVESLGEAIISESPNGTIQSWNPAAERLFGYSAEEMIGAPVAVLAPEDDHDNVFTEHAMGVGPPASRETRGRRRDGVVVDVAITRSALADGSGAITGVVSVLRDVSESRRNAALLTEAESRFAGAFQAASTGMALTALDGRFLAVNPALCRFLERDAATLLASSVQTVTHPDDMPADVKQADRARAGDIDSFQQAKRYVLPGGGIVWGLLTITLARDADGAPRHYVSQVLDITARKTAEAELRRYAAQLQALSRQDPLTGLLNRGAFEIALEEELRAAATRNRRCRVLLVEVEGDDATVTAAASSLSRSSRTARGAARLGHGEFAVLLPGGDARTPAEIVGCIEQAVGDSGVRSSCTTARRGEHAHALIQRVHTQLPDPDPKPSDGRSLRGPEGIARLLEVARAQLGMPVAFLTRLEGDGSVLVRSAGELKALGMTDDEAAVVAGSHRELVFEAGIESSVQDLAGSPEGPDLALTKRLGLRAYARVPVRLRSGQLYGSLCGVDTRPHPEFDRRHAELLSFVSELIAQLIDDETDQIASRRAQARATGVRTLLVALEARDFYTSAHSKDVVELASAVARRFGLGQDATRDVEQVALLHDIGKVGIPDAVLQKQGPLDEQEWELMRQHPVVGEHIIAGTPGLSHLAPAIRAEHEHWDGSGYPDGLAGEQIPLASRITLACDALNAMTSDRPYRPAMTLEHAQQELRACAGTQFDPRAVAALLSEIATLSVDR